MSQLFGLHLSGPLPLVNLAQTRLISIKSCSPLQWTCTLILRGRTSAHDTVDVADAAATCEATSGSTGVNLGPSAERVFDVAGSRLLLHAAGFAKVTEHPEHR
jgi:hypothetical protein